jgi:hypothetical protein
VRWLSIGNSASPGRCWRRSGGRWRGSDRAARYRCATWFQETYPDAEIILFGVEEPQALIHAPNESVDPGKIGWMVLTEALLLEQYAAMRH